MDITLPEPTSSEADKRKFFEVYATFLSNYGFDNIDGGVRPHENNPHAQKSLQLSRRKKQ